MLFHWKKGLNLNYQVRLDLMTVKKGAEFGQNMKNLKESMQKRICYLYPTVNQRYLSLSDF